MRKGCRCYPCRNPHCEIGNPQNKRALEQQVFTMFTTLENKFPPKSRGK